ncbi:MAG: hypothetical protein JO134_22935 [Xanthobacteraceae bacterium]|nr:hypothetical protein [Xanthobacteraceae bacterium]
MAEGQPTYLYFVCSTHPRVGKTLLARLLIEFQHANERPVLGFDLGSDGPALAEFLPEFVTPAAIDDVRSQIALFEPLARNDGAPKVIDLGQRALAQFFMIMREVDFAGEASRRGIKPIILYVAAPGNESARGYAILRDQFPSFGIVPVSNEALLDDADIVSLFPSTIAGMPVLQLPQVPADLQVDIDQRPCFLIGLHQLGEEAFPPGVWAELDDWLRRCFRQMRELDVALLMDERGG